jgi:ribosome-binding factor A
MSRRTDRIEELLQGELSTLLLRKAADPRLRLTSVSGVRVTPDLKRAMVRLSVLGDDEARTAALVAARKAGGFLRGELGRSLRQLRVIPELVFEIDRGAEYSQEISNLLDGLESDDERI